MEGSEIREEIVEGAEIEEESKPEDAPVLQAWQDVSQFSRQTPYLPPTKHAIFLSHSGAQKNFTEQLCEDLDRSHLFPFFDKRPTSLPKGEAFPPLIFSAASQCRVAVLILSDEYFSRSKWPMMELVAFMDAKNSINPSLKLLPLYFHISHHEIKDASKIKSWLSTWEEWARKDPRIDLEKWNQGLAALGLENGLEYDEYRSEVAYRKAVVDAVQFWIPPCLKFDDSQIQGKHRLCQVISKVLDERPENQRTAQVVGMYGTGGSGKTTVCKALCNYYQYEFHGKVCYVEFGKQNQVALQKKVLRELTEASEAVVKQISDPDQGQRLLMERLHRHKVFLALDNVNDTQEMLENARMFLRAGFHPESKVLVTARSCKVLEQLFGSLAKMTSIPVPKLTQEEAIRLFLQHATYENSTIESFSSECKDVIVRCVEQCFQGHPLALKALGARLRIISDVDPQQWSEHLEDLDFKMSHDRVHPIFSILRTSYDALPEGHKFVYIDIALYAPQGVLWSVGNLCNWLGYMHQKKPHLIKEMLMGMRAKTLIDDWVDMDSVVTMHDLYKELAEIEVKEGGFKSSCIYESETPNALTKATLQPRLDLLRVKLLPGSSDTLSKEVMESLLNVEVFSLKGCDRLRKLDLRGFRNLRTLSLQECAKIDEVRCSDAPRTGPAKMLTSMLRSVIPHKVHPQENLSYLRFLNLDNCKSLTRPPDLSGCVNLHELNVSHCDNLVNPPKLTSCSKLRELKIVGCKRLREPPNLSNCTELVEFHMGELENLKDMPRLLQSTALKFVSLHDCKKVKQIHDLEHLTNLVDLGIIGTSIKYADLVSRLNPLKKLKKIRCEISQATGDLGDNIDLQDVKLTTTQLKRSLDLIRWSFLKRLTIYPNELDDVIDLSMFLKLETLYISSNKSYKVTELRGLERMPRLEKIFLWECIWLTRVPDLTELTELKVVNLYNCDNVEDFLRLPKQCKLQKVNWVPS